MTGFGVYRRFKVKKAYPGKKITTKQGRALLFWGAWLLSMAVYFSVAGFFHRYYIAMISPAVGALTAMGVKAFLRSLKKKSRDKFFWYILLGINTLTQAVILLYYPTWRVYLVPLLIILAAGVVFIQNRQKPVPLLCLLLTLPLVWSFTPHIFGGNDIIPYAGPELKDDFMKIWNKSGQLDEQSRKNLIDFLNQNRGDETYALGVPGAMQGTHLMVYNNIHILPFGGFIGIDPILSPDGLEVMVKKGSIRYILLGGTMAFPKMSEAPSMPLNINVNNMIRLSTWIKAEGALVDLELSLPPSLVNLAESMNVSPYALYDLGHLKGESHD
jgi:hypothetical protein